MGNESLNASSVYYPTYIHYNTQSPVVYRGQIVSASIVKLSRTQFMIVDIVVYGKIFRRFAISSVKVGSALYDYINSCGRSGRMRDIDFDITVDPVTQKVLSYVAYDALDYIKDVFPKAQTLVQL